MTVAKRLRIMIACNALDEATRITRHITTDSPAASRKIFMLADALAENGAQVVVSSMGRGRARRKLTFYPKVSVRKRKFVIRYGMFSDLPLFSELLSILSLVTALRRNKTEERQIIIFYNRMTAYIPALIVAKFLGYRCYLDLEDGETYESSPGYMKRLFNFSKRKVFDTLCSDGAILACSALASYTSLTNLYCYYGVFDACLKKDFQKMETLDILVSGTLNPDSGANTLIGALDRLKSTGDAAKLKSVTFHISGIGSSLAEFGRFENNDHGPRVLVHGRLGQDAYQSLLARCDVGLSLKCVSGKYAHTTFPSKVIEYSGHGMLVVSTDISDVKRVFGESGALYLEQDSGEQLAKIVQFIVDNREQCESIRQNGCLRASKALASAVAGRSMIDFLSK